MAMRRPAVSELRGPAAFELVHNYANSGPSCQPSREPAVSQLGNQLSADSGPSCQSIRKLLSAISGCQLLREPTNLGATCEPIGGPPARNLVHSCANSGPTRNDSGDAAWRKRPGQVMSYTYPVCDAPAHGQSSCQLTNVKMLAEKHAGD